jgi:hypothetical protein
VAYAPNVEIVTGVVIPPDAKTFLTQARQQGFKPKVITLGNVIRIATGFSMTGGEQQYADYGLLHDTIMRKIPTTQAASQIELPVIWDPTDPGFIALETAGRTKAKIGIKFALPDGLEILAFGYVGASGMPQASDISSIMTSSVSLTLATRPRYILP